MQLPRAAQVADLKQRYSFEPEALAPIADMSCVNPTVLPKTPLERCQPYPMNRGPNRQRVATASSGRFDRHEEHRKPVAGEAKEMPLARRHDVFR